MKKITLFLCLIVGSAITLADLYTYRDASGKLIYSDVPIPGKTDIHGNKPVAPMAETRPMEEPKKKQKPLSIEERNKQVEERNKKVIEENEAIRRDNAKRAADAQKKAQEMEAEQQKVNQHNCTIARNNLQNAQSGRTANKNESIKRAQQTINEYCR